LLIIELLTIESGFIYFWTIFSFLSFACLLYLNYNYSLWLFAGLSWVKVEIILFDNLSTREFHTIVL